MYKDMIEIISDYFKNIGLKIIEIDNERHIIYAESFIISINSDWSVTLYFKADARGDDTAMIVLLLKDLPILSKKGRLKIGESYFPLLGKKWLWGENAYEKYEKFIAMEVEKEYRYDELMNDDTKFFEC